MKVFVDANVLASAAARAGSSRDVYEAVSILATVFVSEHVLKEALRVLIAKFNIEPAVALASLRALIGSAEIARPSIAPIPMIVPDPDDQVIMSAAIAASVDIFCTRDTALLMMGGHLPFKILNPRQTLEILLGPREN